MKDLPIGITDFAEIRQDDYFYADKTRLLYELVRRKVPHFLSRPRRFGKSLLVNTLENILRGRRDLFKGLWIDGSDYDWTTYPVIKLQMNGMRNNSPQAMETSI
ncbi:MAG: AAA family ATPase, partial [Deltaproteobacteria bacterium]|nr:AAA family ATPase [Deltaproteobacteria bacterium]